MSDWPDRLTVGPLREWPGRLTPILQRKESPFTHSKRVEDPTSHRVGWTRKEVSLRDTLDLLDRELFMLHAKEQELLVAISPAQFRNDGRPRADARPEHPGVILSFVTGVGRLSYPCDTFTTWQANLRAIALALEALRKVDRYGVTKHGEQYRGFLAIEGKPATIRDGAQAYEVIRLWSGIDTLTDPDDLTRAIRLAKRATHPDTGGTADDFQRVNAAEQYLKTRGVL